ncbi:MAG: GNAT family N-acetyltransferase [Chloroflexi bacterium]|nr:GNAT family N-acetyltransferase [Chloroflexota bacterium]
MDIRLLEPQSPTWIAELDRLYAQLGGADNALLFPYHFLQATFPKIGGRLAVGLIQGVATVVGFLFPRGFEQQDRTYTLRYHALSNVTPPVAQEFATKLSALLGCPPLALYTPEHTQHFAPTHQLMGSVDIGRPDATEATQIRQLQQQIWGSTPEFLYPVDMHSLEFGLGTSLVARVEGKTAGFLFGFYKFGESSLPLDWSAQFNGRLRLESQILGVLPAYRGMRLAFLLKKVQAENALQQGIQLINWTVDPLQYPNAALNFGMLGALAFDFTPDYYPFRNELNRVPASRFSLTWLANSLRVRDRLATSVRTTIVDLHRQASIPRVNDRWRTLDEAVDAPSIALEIPTNWTALQQENLDEALQWRMATDALFQRYIGRNPGQYVVTGAGVDGERRFLIAEQVQDALWERLGQT